jgi:heme exporter protein B
VKVLLIALKDIRTEMRAREVVLSTLAFAVLVIVVFNFAFGGRPEDIKAVAPGILWVTFIFAGMLGLTRSFQAEAEESCLLGLMSCPASRDVIYFGKMLANLVFMLLVEALVLPVFAVFFDAGVLNWQVVVIILLATIGFSSAGTLFSALAVNTRARELVLPLLFLPIVSPVIIGATSATGLALDGKTWADIARWLGIIGAFDIIFLAASYLVFSFVIEE